MRVDVDGLRVGDHVKGWRARADYPWTMATPTGGVTKIKLAGSGRRVRAMSGDHELYLEPGYEFLVYRPCASCRVRLMRVGTQLALAKP